MQRERGRAVPSSVARRGAAAGLIALALVVGACRSEARDLPIRGVTVSAATSLTNAFTQLGKAFTDANPHMRARFNFGASSTLADAIVGGASADVFASADQESMTRLQAHKLVSGNPRTFAHNQLVIAVKPGNPAGIGSASDLPKVGVIALCALEVPCGKYAAQALASAKVIVDESRVTRGQNVAATIDQVAAGDAVAAIVYVTDALARADQVDTVAIPDAQNVIAAYPIAKIGRDRYGVADAFVRFVAGTTGQRILKQYGFLP